MLQITAARAVLCVSRCSGDLTAATRVGDIIKVTVRAIPRGKVKKGQVLTALVVRTKKGVRRGDGSLIRFDDNAAILLNNQNPLSAPAFLVRLPANSGMKNSCVLFRWLLKCFDSRQRV